MTAQWILTISLHKLLLYSLLFRLWIVQKWGNNWFSRYLKWPDIVRTALICVLLAHKVKGRNACGASWDMSGKGLHQSHLQTMYIYIYPPVPCICHFFWTPHPLKTTAQRCFEAPGNPSSATRCHISVNLDARATSVQTSNLTRYKPSRAPYFVERWTHLHSFAMCTLQAVEKVYI